MVPNMLQIVLLGIRCFRKPLTINVVRYISVPNVLFYVPLGTLVMYNSMAYKFL